MNDNAKAAVSSTVDSACSAWDSWTRKALEIELTDRILYFCLQTDGKMQFPNSAEGDLLKLAWAMINKPSG